MDSTIKIITIPLSRWEEYKELRLEALEKESHAFGAKHSVALLKPEEEWTERVKSSETEEKDIMVFAEHNGKLIGMIGAYFNKSGENSSKANIWGVYVKDEFRGKGVGKQLMNAILTKLKTKPNLEKVVLMVNREQLSAVGLYQSLGFNQIGTERFTLGDGKEHDEIIMELSL